LLPWQYGEPVYPSAPQSEFLEQSTSPQLPFEQACPDEHVCFNLAVELFVQLALTVPGLLHVYVL
jgi:hypothetical protein